MNEPTARKPDVFSARLLSASIGALFALEAPDLAAREFSTHGFLSKLFVTNCENDGPGSLRAVLAGAHNGDLIDFSRLTCSTITLTTGELSTYLNDISLGGNVTISAAGGSRVLSHLGSGTLELSGITIADGKHVADWITAGGCVYTRGNLFAIGATVKNCTASSKKGPFGMVLGGGVFVAGSAFLASTSITGNTIVCENDDDFGQGAGIYARQLTLSGSTISANKVETSTAYASSVKAGGGFYSRSGVYIGYSTISGNSADFGGGGRQSGDGVSAGVSTIKNSTISGNTARLGAAGIVSSDALLKIWNSTIAFNVSKVTGAAAITTCGGILAFGGDEYLSLRSTIVADNRIGDEAGDVCTTPYTAPIIGYGNLVVAANRPLPADTLRSDPMLEALAYNGGATQTHGLLPGSPAIDAGNNSAWLNYDQRNLPRTIGAQTDIGAYEQQPNVIFDDSFDEAESTSFNDPPPSPALPRS